MTALVTIPALIATGVGLNEATRALAVGHPMAALLWLVGSLAMLCAGLAAAYVKGEQS